MNFSKLSFMLSILLCSTSVFSFGNLTSSLEIKENYAYSGLSMAVPENYSLQTIYGCLTLDVYTPKSATQKITKVNNDTIDFKAVCNTGEDDFNIFYDVDSYEGAHYITSSKMEITTSYSDLVKQQHFSEVFSKSKVNSPAAFEEASFLLAQVAELLLEHIAAEEVENSISVRAVTASVSRDSQRGITFNGTYFGRVLTTTGTIRPQDIGTGSTCNNTSRSFTQSFGTGNCGHIIARNLGGSGLVTSPARTQIFPQDPSINSGIYNQWEQRIAGHINVGCNAYASIYFYYSGTSLRPNSVSYRIYRNSSTQTCVNDFIGKFGNSNYATTVFPN